MQLLPLRAGESLNRKIFRAAIVIGILTLLVKIGGTVKELIVARTFGRGDALDAFLIAFLLPGFMLGLVMSAFSSTLIPGLVEAREKRGADAAQQLFSSMMFLSALVLVALAVLLALLAPYYLPFLGSGFSEAKLLLTRNLLYTLLPFVVFGGFAGCIAAVLNAGERFSLPALAPLLTPLAIIVFIVGAAKWGPFTLAGGTIAGSVLEGVLLAWALQRHGMRLRLRWHGLTPDVRRVLGQCAPMLAGSFLMSSTGVVDQSMAAMLPAGSVAALGYANKIVAVILTICATALSTAAFPYISKMVAQNNWSGCWNTLKKYSILVAVTTVPLTVGVMVFSLPLVRILFERGAFTRVDTELVSWTQVCYSIHIPFYICGSIFVRFLLSVRRSDLLMIISAINLIMDVILNIVLMKRWGVAGIALSTSLMHILAFAAVSMSSVVLLRRKSVRLSAAEAPATNTASVRVE